ncbi:MAG: ABC transporter ATP-binding protein [Muribaculaceae bacterium]
MSTAILETRNLAIGYRKGKQQHTVMSNLNLALDGGSIVCILGANGIGKSTLLRTIAGTQQPLSGTIDINGNDISKLQKRDLAKLLGLVYTDRTQAGGLTVTELVSLGRQPHTGFLGHLSSEDYIIISRAISDAGISHKSHSFIAELSDGERQKAMIAKALAQETPIIILDEPTAFLDVSSKIETMRLLHSLAHTAGKTILLSSHDISQSLLLADFLWVITANGEIKQGVTEDIILSGTLDEMFRNDNIHFNSAIGDFCTEPNFSRKVNVCGSSQELIHWCCNALHRNGIGNDRNAKDCVTINSPCNITVSLSGNTVNANSISNLLSVLNRYNN